MEQSVAERPLSQQQCISQHHMQNDGTVNSSDACFGKDPSEKWYPRRWAGWRGTDAHSGNFGGDHWRQDKVQLCRDNLRGSCARGSSCKYQHSACNEHDGSRFYQNEQENLGVVANLGNFQSYREKNDNDTRSRFSSIGCRSRSPCRRFLSGRCYRGASCPYFHPELTGHESLTHDRLMHDASAAQQQVDGSVRNPGFGEGIRENTLRISQQRDEVNKENNLRMKSFSGEHRSRSPCRNFLRGNCKFGALCKRWHPVNTHVRSGHDLNAQHYQGVAEASSNPGCGEGSQCVTLRTPQEHDQLNMHNQLRPGNFSREPISREPCRNFLRGKCYRGDSCVHLHPVNTHVRSGYDLNTQRYQGVADASSNPDYGEGSRRVTLRTPQEHDQLNMHNQSRPGAFSREPKNRSPCRSFLSGKCYRGDSCVHLHPVTVYDRTRYAPWRAQQHEVSAASRASQFSNGNTATTLRMSQVHEESKNFATQSFRDMNAIYEQKVREVCLQFTKGRCNRGELCKYLHGYHEYASSNWKKPSTESGCFDKETKGQSVSDVVEQKIVDQKGDAPVMGGRECEVSGQTIVNICSSAQGHEDISLWSRPFKRRRSRSRSPFTPKDNFRFRNTRRFDCRSDLCRDRCCNVAQFQYPDRHSYKYERPMHNASGQQHSKGEATSVNPCSVEHNVSKPVAPQRHDEVGEGPWLHLCPKGSFGLNIAVASKNEAEPAGCALQSSHTDQSDEEIETDSTGADSSDGAPAVSQEILESDSTSSIEEHHVSPAAAIIRAVLESDSTTSSAEHHVSPAANGLITSEKQGDIEVSIDVGQESNEKPAELTPTIKTYSRKDRKIRCPKSLSCEETVKEELINGSKQGMPSSSLAEDSSSNPNNDLENALMCDHSVKLKEKKKRKKKRPRPILCEETMREGVNNVSEQGAQSSSLVETSSSNPNRSMTNKTVNNVDSALATTEVGTLLVGNTDSHSLQALQFPSKAVPMSRRKLLVLDVNGILVDIVTLCTQRYKPDTTVSGKGVFKRPFCDDFLQFCFKRFDVGIWSSRNKKNLNKVVDFLMGDTKKRLLFCWDQSHCTETGYKTLENKEKPLVLKELKILWDNEGKCLPWDKGYYNETNTVLLDDSPYKALRNPPHTAIFPLPYKFRNANDDALGPGGKLRVYLERLSEAENVQKFIQKYPFGQKPISESNLSWAFYAKIVGTSASEQKENANSAPES